MEKHEAESEGCLLLTSLALVLQISVWSHKTICCKTYVHTIWLVFFEILMQMTTEDTEEQETKLDGSE